MLTELRCGATNAMSKECNRCLERLPAEHFSLQRNICKNCRAIQERQRRVDCRDEIRIKDRARSKTPKRKEQQRQKDLRRRDKPERRAQLRAAYKRYREKNREKIHQSQKERYWADPIKFRKRAREDLKRLRLADPIKARLNDKKQSGAKRARKRNTFVEQVDAQKVFERDAGICGICKNSVSLKEFHIDHIIPLSKHGEHSYANVQLAHPFCNMQKGAKLPEGENSE